VTEEEIMIRAREAYIVADRVTSDSYLIAVRDGEFDGRLALKTAAQALRDASKPLSEIQPVDPDLIEARECAALVYEERENKEGAEELRRGEYDDNAGVQVALLAIKRAKERTQGGAA